MSPNHNLSNSFFFQIDTLIGQYVIRISIPNLWIADIDIICLWTSFLVNIYMNRNKFEENIQWGQATRQRKIFLQYRKKKRENQSY